MLAGMPWPLVLGRPFIPFIGFTHLPVQAGCWDWDSGGGVFILLGLGRGRERGRGRARGLKGSGVWRSKKGPVSSSSLDELWYERAVTRVDMWL